MTYENPVNPLICSLAIHFYTVEFMSLVLLVARKIRSNFLQFIYPIRRSASDLQGWERVVRSWLSRVSPTRDLPQLETILIRLAR